MQARLVDRVRFRLLAALVVLLAAAIALVLLGWFGMGSAQRALAGFEGEVLPNVTQALELAERTAKLAAIAPTVGESRTPEVLQLNQQSIDLLLREIRGRVEALPGDSALLPVLRERLANVDRDLKQLLDVTRERQASQIALQQQLTEIDRIAGALPEATRSALFGQPRFAAIWSDLVVGAGSDDPATLGRLEADVEALWVAARRDGQVADPPTSFLESLSAMSQGPGNVLALRGRQLELDRRTAYLVVLTRGNADQLSDEVGQYVGSLREQAAKRRAEVQQAISSRETGMLLLAAGCVLIAALATRYVQRFVGEIETITAEMTRLARGDTAEATLAHGPAAQRRDELGALARSFGVFRDALLAKQSLLGNLRTQGELVAAVNDNMTDALAVFDAQGALLLWNPRFVDLFGPHGVTPRAGLAARQFLLGLPPATSWLAPGQTGRQPLAVLDVADDGSHAADAFGFDLARFGQIELHLPDGAVYDLRSRRMPDGGSVTLATDLTARRAIESQAQQAQRLDVLGQLTGGVAHDFNNHLGTIIGNLGLVAEEADLADDARTRLQRARRAAASAAALTRRLLAFARSQPLDAERVDIDAMIEEMQDLIEYSAGPQTVVGLQLAGEDAHVLVDRGHLENALLNLVLNSAAAMPVEGRLTISTRTLGGARPMLEIAVADNGAGIPEPLRDRVFEPFFTTKPAGKGNGLGLSGVYGFVKQSGGDIALASQVGQGTTITLSLPIVGGEGADAPRAAIAAAGAAGGLAGRRVLVVDDDEAFRATVTDMLQAAGVQVIAAADAEEALALFEREAAFDAALTDVGLGTGPDGLALARAMRLRQPGLPICLMSGLPFEPLLQRPEWQAGLGLLNKPFDAAALAAQLRGA